MSSSIVVRCPTIREGEAIPGRRLLVRFADGSTRVYDCTPLLADPAFHALNDDAFFRSVRADAHGFGVVWNDAVDLAESELWLHGAVEDPSPSEEERTWPHPSMS